MTAKNDLEALIPCRVTPAQTYGHRREQPRGLLSSHVAAPTGAFFFCAFPIRSKPAPCSSTQEEEIKELLLLLLQEEEEEENV